MKKFNKIKTFFVGLIAALGLSGCAGYADATVEQNIVTSMTETVAC